MVDLLTHGGTGEICFGFVHRYKVVHVLPEDEANIAFGHRRGPYKVSTSFYQYQFLDIAGNEILVYHWEPESGSPVLAPHLHVPSAGAIRLPQRPGWPREEAKTHLGKLHMLTGRVFLEDMVEILIREFRVDSPLGPDGWEPVLQSNREAIQ